MTKALECPACGVANPPGKERCGRCDRALEVRRVVEVPWSATTRDGVSGAGLLVIVTTRTAADGAAEVAQAAFWAAVEKWGPGVTRDRAARTMEKLLRSLLPRDYALERFELKRFEVPAGVPQAGGGAASEGTERVPSLKWTGDGRAATITLGALAVNEVRLLLSERTLAGLPFRLEGAHKAVEVIPAPKRGKQPPPLSVDGETLRLVLSADLAQGFRRKLRPRCGEYRWQELPGLQVEVAESKILNEAGNVARVIGWEPLADEEEERIKGLPRRRRSLGRRLALAALVLALGAPAALVGSAAVYFRHVPYAIPAELSAPALGVEAGLGTGLRLRFLGVSGYELTDERTTLLLDPTPTRPTVLELLAGPLEPDPELHRSLRRADFILVNHAHFDHVLDVPALALRTGAVVVGTRSTVNLARSRGVPAERTIVAEPGRRLRLGTFTVDVRASRHTKLVGMDGLMEGVIPEDAGPLWFWQYTQDGALSFRLEANGTSVWFHPTSTYTQGELGGLRAGTLILGVTGEPLTRAKAEGILAEARPARVLPTHYDNFLQPLSRGMALMPGLDLEAARALVADVAPAAEWWLLDFGQQTWLPPDGSGSR